MYAPCESTALSCARIILNTNENPLGCSEHVVDALQARQNLAHRYPDPNQIKLRHALSLHHNIPTSHILCGNGSDALLELLVSFLSHNSRARCLTLLVQNDYFIYRKILDNNAQLYEEVSEKHPESIIAALIERLTCSKKETPTLVCLANPTNPMGFYYPTQQVVRLLQAAKQAGSYVLIDEAYCHFVQASNYPDSLALLRQFEHLIVLRTFSKAYGLAGMRLGYLLGPEALVTKLLTHKLPFHTNIYAHIAGPVALQDQNHIKRTYQLIAEQKTIFYRRLTQLKLTYIPSQTNFVFIHWEENVEQLYTYMEQHHIIINPLREYALPHAFRVSIGLPEHNDQFFIILQRYLNRERRN